MFFFLLGHLHILLRSVLHAIFAQQIHSITWHGNDIDLSGNRRGRNTTLKTMTRCLGFPPPAPKEDFPQGLILCPLDLTFLLDSCSVRLIRWGSHRERTNRIHPRSGKLFKAYLRLTLIGMAHIQLKLIVNTRGPGPFC